MTETSFQSRVIQWATDRNIIGGSTPKDQFLKLVEEIGEIADGIDRDDANEIKDGIGDSAVVVMILARQCNISIYPESVEAIDTDLSESSMMAILGDLSGSIQKGRTIRISEKLIEIIGFLKAIASAEDLDFNDCCEHAWGEIKDRKGEMRNGVFVKEAAQ